MELDTRDMILKKLVDAQEMVRDFKVFSKETDDEQVASMFKTFAEETGLQARELRKLADYYRKS